MNELAVHGTAAVVYVEGEIPWGTASRLGRPVKCCDQDHLLSLIYTNT